MTDRAPGRSRAGAPLRWPLAAPVAALAREGRFLTRYTYAGPITGFVVVAGAVRTERPSLSVLERGTARRPTDYFADHKAFATVYDFARVCVAGAGRPAVGGSATYTLVANGSAADVVIVLQCTFSGSGPSCS